VLKNKEYRLIVHDAMMASKAIKDLEQVNISNYTDFGSDKIEINKRKIPVAVTVFFEIL